MEKKLKILIVADQQPDLDVLVDLLKPDYRIVTATNGKQALISAGDPAPPDLILLGIVSPESEGCDVCRRLKADQTTRGIPLILIVSSRESDFAAGGLELGAVDCITKPVSPPPSQGPGKDPYNLESQG